MLMLVGIQRQERAAKITVLVGGFLLLALKKGHLCSAGPGSLGRGLLVEVHN